jgi:DNA-directed RNA polymerase I, II, and III subunit RPABC1
MNILDDCFKSKKTIVEMLNDRQFLVPDSIRNLSIENFKELYNSRKYDILVKHRSENRKLYVTYIFGDIRSASLKELITNIKVNIFDNEDQHKIIFIFITKPVVSIIKIINEYKYQYFSINKLQFNITKHILVSKHELLSEADHNALLAKYNIKANQLPCILSTDPIIKYYDYPKGGICKISRISKSSIDTIFYRYIK